MLDLGGEDDVAGLEVGVAPAAGDEVDALGGAARENDLGGIGGMDESRDSRACALVGVGGAHGEGVEAAVDVAVVALVVVHERVDDGARFLGGGAVVEVDEGFAVDLLVQDREIGADFLEIEHGGRQSTWLSVVVVGIGSDFIASIAACQPSVAHLMRAGKEWTPAKAARSLISSGAWPVVTMSWKFL